MSTAIVRQDQAVATLDDVQRVARLLAASNYFDAKGNGEQAIAQLATKILAGREMGYGPFASVQGIHVIQGKPVISANLMAAAVKRSGRYDYRVRRLDNDGCEVEFFQRTGDKLESIGKSAFTRDDAKAAGLLGKDNWSKFARNMFFARALSNGIRWYCADVFDGSAAYTPDELGVDEDADGNVITVQAHVIQEDAAKSTPAAPSTATGNANGAAGNGNEAAALKGFMAAGTELFGKDWNQARPWLIERYTTKETPSNVRRSSKDLEIAELKALKQNLEEYAKGIRKAWDSYRAEVDSVTVFDASELDPDALTVPA